MLLLGQESEGQKCLPREYDVYHIQFLTFGASYLNGD